MHLRSAAAATAKVDEASTPSSAARLPPAVLEADDQHEVGEASETESANTAAATSTTTAAVAVTMRLSESVLTLAKFRGAILGGLVGDCCGGPFDGQSVLKGGERTLLRKNLDRLEGPFFNAPEKAYSDDSIMSRSVAQTLIDHRRLDQTAMCKSFVREYLKDPHRGYGEAVVHVFRKLRQSRFTDLERPAAEQFGGSGSFGNGSAMRIAPVALFCHGMKSRAELVQMVEQATRPTHTHALAVNGAILQALAVEKALKADSSEPLDGKRFVNELIEEIGEVEGKDDEDLGLEPQRVFAEQLSKVIKLLGRDPSEVEVVNMLGNQVSALFSVPTAIHCFLRGQSKIPGIISENPFRRTIEYAISLGGDTDTIASMSGVLCGAFYGDSIIPENLRKHCERNVEFGQLAENLFEARGPKA